MKREELLKRYVDLNWALVPCAFGSKRPITSHGYKDAMRDLNAIVALDRKHEGRLNWAVALEASNLLVLDVDENPNRALSLLERAHGKFHARAPIAFTPSGGLHIYFYTPEPLPTTKDGIGAGVETRCRGAMTMLPISVVDGVSYRWYRAPWECERIPSVPWWVVDVLRKRAEARAEEMAQKRMDGILRFVMTRKEGQRNNALYWAARRLREMQIPADRALLLLLPASRSTGLDEREIVRTVRSAYGL